MMLMLNPGGGKDVYTAKQRISVWRGKIASSWSFNETNIEMLLTELVWMHQKKEVENLRSMYKSS